MFREWDVIAEYIGKGSIPILAFEGRGAEQHLIDKYTQCPPIDCACMTATLYDFGRDILFGANE